MIDRNVEAVINKMRLRAKVGVNKYGVSTERKDYSDLEWLENLQDELMDASIYLQVIIAKMENSDDGP